MVFPIENHHLKEKECKYTHTLYCWQLVVCGIKSVQAPKIIAQNTRQGYYFIFRIMTIVPTTTLSANPSFLNLKNAVDLLIE